MTLLSGVLLIKRFNPMLRWKVPALQNLFSSTSAHVAGRRRDIPTLAQVPTRRRSMSQAGAATSL